MPIYEDGETVAINVDGRDGLDLRDGERVGDDKPEKVSKSDIPQNEVAKWLAEYVRKAEGEGRSACNQALQRFGSKEGFEGLSRSRNQWMQVIDDAVVARRGSNNQSSVALPDSANAATTIQGLLHDSFTRGDAPFDIKARASGQEDEDAEKIAATRAWLKYELDRLDDGDFVFQQLVEYLVDPVVIEAIDVEPERHVEWKLKSEEVKISKERIARETAKGLAAIEGGEVSGPFEEGALEMRLAELRQPAWKQHREVVTAGYDARVRRRTVLPENFIFSNPYCADVQRQPWVIEVVPDEPLTALRRQLEAMDRVRQSGEAVFSGENLRKLLLYLQQQAQPSKASDSGDGNDGEAKGGENATPDNALPTVKMYHYWGELPYYAMIDEFGEEEVKKFLAGQITEPGAESPDLDGVWHLSVADDDFLLQCGPSPYWASSQPESRLPYNTTWAFTSLPRSAYGISFLDKMQSLSDFVNDMFAAMTDNLRKIVNNSIGIDSNSGIDPDEYREVVNTNDGVMYMERIAASAKDAIASLAPPDISVHALRAIDFGGSKFREMAPANVAQQGGARQTATYTNFVAEGISAQINSLARGYARLRKRSLRQFAKTAIQYFTRAKWIRLLGEEGATVEIDPTKLLDEFDIDISLALKHANELARSAQIINAIQILAPLQALEPVETTKMVLRYLRVDKAEIDRVVVGQGEPTDLTLKQKLEVLSLNEDVTLSEIPSSYEGMAIFLNRTYQFERSAVMALIEELRQAGMPFDAAERYLQVLEEAAQKIMELFATVQQALAAQAALGGPGMAPQLGALGGNGGMGQGQGAPQQPRAIPGQTQSNMQQNVIANRAGASPVPGGM